MNKKFFSITFEVHDQDKFMKAAGHFSGHMLSSPGEIAERGYDVTACGWGDVYTQADAFKRAIEEEGIEPLEAIETAMAEDMEEPIDWEKLRQQAKEVMGM